jgi:hypothetical protein
MHLARSSTRARLATRCTSGNSFENAEDRTLRRRRRDRHDISATRQIAKRYRHLIVQLAESHRAPGLPDLRFRQQTARATEAFNTHRRADDAPCGRI